MAKGLRSSIAHKECGSTWYRNGLHEYMCPAEYWVAAWPDRMG